eukprot:jgi/Undpi1/13824/HiC_scaffold_9.g03475.m1
MNVIQEIKRINERELQQGVSSKASWHHEYKDSAWVFAGGFPYDLTEGDLLCVMSQWGEIEDINLCREKDTGKSKGFCFVKYENQRSTILAVDNFNGIELLGRTIRVDHKHKYSLPKEVRERAEKQEEERVARGEEPSTKGAQWRPGVAYEGKELATAHNFHKGFDVFAPAEKGSASSDDSENGGGGVPGESAAAKQKRREAKKERKELRRKARERKKKDRDSAADHGSKKKKKHHKKDGGKGDKSSKSHADDSKRKKGDLEANGLGANARRDGRDRESAGGGADAAGVWERGTRAPGDGASSASLFAPAQAPSRAPAPQSLSTGNVMDWRGLGGGGAGGRGGRGGGRGREGGGRGGGRGGREGGRGGGMGGRGDGGRGDGGSRNSLGGMDRRR